MVEVHKLPENFIILQKEIPQLWIDLKYCGSDNLIGRPLVGYATKGSALLTREAAQSIKKIIQVLQKPEVAKELNISAPVLKLFDAYRPQMACDDFWEWSQSDCQKTKPHYYPNIEKRDLFKLGYIARQSSHCRGSTVDVTIADAVSGEDLYMGTPFDFMDDLSHPANPAITGKPYYHRQFLKKLMADAGWKGIDQEWWHFTFSEEPFVDTYFNFPVENYANE